MYYTSKPGIQYDNITHNSAKITSHLFTVPTILPSSAQVEEALFPVFRPHFRNLDSPCLLCMDKMGNRVDKLGNFSTSSLLCTFASSEYTPLVYIFLKQMHMPKR